MTKKTIYAVALIGIASVRLVFAQEPATPLESPLATATPSPAVTPAAARNVRISFLPPPLEGTISLGIFDSSGKLVRILHQQAELDDFTVGADALVTKWDGKDDDGQDLPPGKYHARGFLVGHLKVENLGKDATAAADTGSTTPAKVQMKLMSNPLGKSERPSIEMELGFDRQDTFLKSADGLPLYVISERANITQGTLAKNGEKSVDVWQDDGTGPEHLRISNLEKIMAFDCGEIELK